MANILHGRSAQLRREIERLEQEIALLRNQFESAPGWDAMHASRYQELERLCREELQELATKRVVVFGTAHNLQNNGHCLNSELECRLSFLIEQFAVTVLMEEWATDLPPSFASVFTRDHISYSEVGTPSESRFQTFCNAPINHPGHDGTLGPCEDAPPFHEYGALDKQQNREHRMVQNIQTAMTNHHVGLFIVGLAHLHSIAVKLSETGFTVAAYSWIG
jgi:hypothetical protein